MTARRDEECVLSRLGPLPIAYSSSASRTSAGFIARWNVTTLGKSSQQNVVEAHDIRNTLYHVPQADVSFFCKTAVPAVSMIIA